MTYRDMMERTASLLGVKRPMLGVPLLSPRLSRLWVSLITGAPRELVAPLLASLRHELVARDQRIYEITGVTPMPFDEAVRTALLREGDRSEAQRPRAFVGETREHKGVRSVQRLRMPGGHDALWAAESYMSWLPWAMWPLITVTTDENRCCRFYLRGLSKPLLVLQFARGRSRRDRQLFYVVGGILSRDRGRGRLEMRLIPDSDNLLCALHDFRPRLTWLVYTMTQAIAHVFVMRAFARHLARAGLLATAL